MADQIEIVSGQTWFYKGTTPKHGKTGDEYVVTGTPLMKIGDSDRWVKGVIYVRLANGSVADDEEPKLFVRDEEKFREKFEFLPK